MGSKTIATVGVGMVTLAFVIGVRVASPETCGFVLETGSPIPATCVPPNEIAERMETLRQERSVREWNATCRIVEHGPTGPEPTVNVGWTVRACGDGTRHISEWSIATGEILVAYVVGAK